VRQFAIIANVADSVRGWREWQFEVTFSLQIKAVRRGLSRNHYRIPPRNTCADTLGYPWDRIKKKENVLGNHGITGTGICMRYRQHAAMSAQQINARKTRVVVLCSETCALPHRGFAEQGLTPYQKIYCLFC